MCGIIYCQDKSGKSVNKLIKRKYFLQKTRGSNGFGFIDIEHFNYQRAKWEHEIGRASCRERV